MQNIIIRLLVCCLPVVMAVACKKDNATSSIKETVLSKEYEDGKLAREYEYNSDRQLQKLNEYNTGTGKLSYVAVFEYNKDGWLKTLTNFNGSGKATSRYQYTTDSKGRFEQQEYVSLSGADSGKVNSRVKYTYNADRRISKEAWVSLVSGKELYYRTFSYYPNGNLKSYEYYGDLSPMPELYWKADYTPAGNPLPAGIEKSKGYPINFLIPYYTAENIHFYSYDGPVVDAEYEDKISERTYNEKGLITGQIITTQYILPVQPDSKRVMMYEYKDI